MKTATLFRFKSYTHARAFCNVLTDPIYDMVRIPGSFDGAEAHDPMQHEQKLTAYCYGVLVEFEGSNAEEIAAAYARQAMHVVACKTHTLIGLPTPSRFIVLSDIASVRLKQVTLHDCQSHDESKDNPPYYGEGYRHDGTRGPRPYEFRHKKSRVYGRRTSQALSKLPAEDTSLNMGHNWTVVYRFGMNVMVWDGKKMTSDTSPTAHRFMTRPEAMQVWRRIRDKYKELYGADVSRRILIARKA